MEEVSYVEAIKFNKNVRTESKRIEYPSSEAYVIYLKVIQKYKENKESILVCLRDKDDNLVKSELLNYEIPIPKKL